MERMYDIRPDLAAYHPIAAYKLSFAVGVCRALEYIRIYELDDMLGGIKRQTRHALLYASDDHIVRLRRFRGYVAIMRPVLRNSKYSCHTTAIIDDMLSVLRTPLAHRKISAANPFLTRSADTWSVSEVVTYTDSSSKLLIWLAMDRSVTLSA